MQAFVTPADLAQELGVTQTRIREFLRAEHGKLLPPVTRWELDEDQAARVRAHFRARA